MTSRDISVLGFFTQINSQNLLPMFLSSKDTPYTYKINCWRCTVFFADRSKSYFIFTVFRRSCATIETRARVWRKVRPQSASSRKLWFLPVHSHRSLIHNCFTRACLVASSRSTLRSRANACVTHTSCNTHIYASLGATSRIIVNFGPTNGPFS